MLLKIPKFEISRKSVPCCAAPFSPFHADRGTDMMGLVVAFHVWLVNAPKSNENEEKFNLQFS
jgi:hypothetical protein